MKGYIEFVTYDRVGFITNSFGRILYINREFPDGEYEPFKMSGLAKELKKNCKEGRKFTFEELMLELL